MTEDINVCIAACFEAGAAKVVVRDGHSKGLNVDPAYVYNPDPEMVESTSPDSVEKALLGKPKRVNEVK